MNVSLMKDSKSAQAVRNTKRKSMRNASMVPSEGTTTTGVEYYFIQSDLDIVDFCSV